MLVAVSVDMEGASQLGSVREIWGGLPEYWETGKPRLEADVTAACEGLLAGGASELVVLDNHGGNTVNVSPEALPEGARLETWRDFDLHDHGVDAMFQVGYHARGGVDGFLSHTYVPGLRLRAGGELISESHGRAWASVLGITGNDLLRSVSCAPYLEYRSRRSLGRDAMQPSLPTPRSVDSDPQLCLAHAALPASALPADRNVVRRSRQSMPKAARHASVRNLPRGRHAVTRRCRATTVFDA